MKEKVLVTGGAGYVGWHLSNVLLDAGYYVRVYDNLLYNQKVDETQLKNNSFEFVSGDIRDINSLKKALLSIDYVVHLAGLTGEPACKKNQNLCTSLNTIAVNNLDKIRSGKPLIFASSTSIYGETQKRHCTEETIPTPTLPYSISKYESEKILSNSKNVVIFRPATAFGVSYRHRLDLLINNFVFQAVKNKIITVYDPEVWRTFISVEDLANAYLLAIKNFKFFNNQIFNIGFDNLNLSKNTIIDKIKEQTKCEIIIENNKKDPDNRNFTVDYSKIKNHGLEETVTLDEGISKMIKSYKALESDPSYYCINFKEI